MQKQINTSGVKIFKKNKDYGSVQEASIFYEKKRMTILAETYFPETEYPEGFKELVIGLMIFQNPVQMNVWHNRDVVITSNGERICTTWDNLCTFQRKFTCAEMIQCVEILKRATSYECWISCQPESQSIHFTSILNWFNEEIYPKLTSISNHIETVLLEIEEQLCKPIRDKINTDLKIMMQLPLTQKVEFIKARERRM